MQLKEIKNIFHEELDPIYSKEEVDSFFYMLIENHLGLERFVLALQPNLTITKEEEQPLFEGLSRLKMEHPIQYIIGKAYFMEMDFRVDENVLIPRRETEELVRWIINELRVNHSPNPKILDIGTGSGCIAISLAKNLPDTKVFALDVSEKALNIAKENAEIHQVGIEFIHADILKLESLNGMLDLIVSNPPYVRESEKKNMGNNVKKHEPESALFVSDGDPLIFYREIVSFATENLLYGGALFLEVNQYLAKETKQLLEDQNFTDIELRKDMFGNYRMLKGIKDSLIHGINGKKQ